VIPKWTQPVNRSACFCCHSSRRKFFQLQQCFEVMQL